MARQNNPDPRGGASPDGRAGFLKQALMAGVAAEEDFAGAARFPRGGAMTAPDQQRIAGKEEERAKQLENDHRQQTIDLQKQMFRWVRLVVSLWLSFIVVFLGAYVALNAFYPPGFVLDKEIIVTLLATTTLNILGLPFVITKSLFKG